MIGAQPIGDWGFRSWIWWLWTNLQNWRPARSLQGRTCEVPVTLDNPIGKGVGSRLLTIEGGKAAKPCWFSLRPMFTRRSWSRRLAHGDLQSYYTILRIPIVTNIIHNKWQRGIAQEVWAWLINVDLAHVITSGTRMHASWIASRVPAARTLQPFQLTRAGSSPFKRVWRNYAPWRHKGLQGAPLTCSSCSSGSSTCVSTMRTKCICINTNESVHNIWV